VGGAAGLEIGDQHRGGAVREASFMAEAVASRMAARASNRVESSVGRGETSSFRIRGSSVHPRTTASHFSSVCILSMMESRSKRSFLFTLLKTRRSKIIELI